MVCTRTSFDAGSTDGVLGLHPHYFEDPARIELASNSKKGARVATNVGKPFSHGDWILFVNVCRSTIFNGLSSFQHARREYRRRA